MKTVLLLMAQYNRTLLSIEQVADLFGKAPQTIRNRVSAGTFPAPTDGMWHVEIIAEHIERTMNAPGADKAA